MKSSQEGWESGQITGGIRRFFPRIAATALIGCLPVGCVDSSGDADFEPVYPECSELGDGGVAMWQLGWFYDDPARLEMLENLAHLDGGIVLTDPVYAEWLLSQFEAAGLTLTLQLVKREDCLAADGSFDQDKWKANLDGYEGVDLSRFIENGTWVGVLLLDDLGLNEGESIDSSIFDWMAEEVQKKFDIPEGIGFSYDVRQDPTDIYSYNYDGNPLQVVNRGHLQINSKDVQDRAGGDTRVFLADEIYVANEMGLGCMRITLNFPDWVRKEEDQTCTDLGRPEGFRTDSCGILPEEALETLEAIDEVGCWGTGMWQMNLDRLIYLTDDYLPVYNYMSTVCS